MRGLTDMLTQRASAFFAIGFAVVALTVAGSIGAAEADTNGSLTGTWDIVKVAVDRRDQPHWLYRPDDPRFLGRELVISAEQIRLNDGSAICARPHWSKRMTTWGRLLEESFARPPSARTPSKPSPGDFGLKVPAATAVAAYSPACTLTNGQRSAPPWDRTWFVQQDANSLMMRLGSSALLLLSRRPVGAKPRASFSCANAVTPTERALCASVGLAALDRSVAAAWRDALTRQPGQTERLRNEQAEWLKARDACGADGACLGDQMQRRIDALVQE